jgi:hypothetical protein
MPSCSAAAENAVCRACSSPRTLSIHREIQRMMTPSTKTMNQRDDTGSILAAEASWCERGDSNSHALSGTGS